MFCKLWRVCMRSLWFSFSFGIYNHSRWILPFLINWPWSTCKWICNMSASTLAMILYLGTQLGCNVTVTFLRLAVFLILAMPSFSFQGMIFYYKWCSCWWWNVSLLLRGAFFSRVSICRFSFYQFHQNLLK